MSAESEAELTGDLRMLEIGALTPDNYGSCSNWIENHPIDLNSRYPGIVEQDFLQRPLPSDDSAQFDIISCSLVVNFVPEPKDRGMCVADRRRLIYRAHAAAVSVSSSTPTVVSSLHRPPFPMREQFALPDSGLVQGSGMCPRFRVGLRTLAPQQQGGVLAVALEGEEWQGGPGAMEDQDIAE